MKFKSFFIVSSIIILIVLIVIFFLWIFPNFLQIDNNNIILNSSGELLNKTASNVVEESTNTALKNTMIIELADTIPEYDFYFELPINGATGYASINMNIVDSPKSNKVIKNVSAGTAFKILSESENWWNVELDGKEGWIDNTYCMINLPDVIPSIIYDDTNSYKSIFKSSSIDIPNVTGEQLYNVYNYNDRLSKEEYMMPIMYSMAKKIMLAQNYALEENYSLKIYETYRPYDTQRKVCDNLKKLISENKNVYEGIYRNGWSEDWFISQSTSNHQKGIAMDVSLVKVNETTVKTVGKYKYLSITDYTEEEMPTKMHELSDAAVTFQYGVPASSKTAWKDVPLAKTMTEGAKKLQKYCTKANLTPLSSEWWHFNDLDSKEKIGSKYSTGKYQIKNCLSTIPN